MGIAPMGGIVCQDTPWPFTLQRLDDSGVWQDVVFPPTPPCIGVAVAMLPPGQSQSTTFAASADPGTYRVAYTFRAADGTEGTATSTPFLIGSP
jgi:hypothetical protein